MSMHAYPLTRFACGHVGRNNEGIGRRRTVSTFIRVAHIGTSRVEESTKKCPDCSKGIGK